MPILYKHLQLLTANDSGIFDTPLQPGMATPHSGIYRCAGCGHAIVSETGKSLPPQNHHQHTTIQGSMRWQLVVLPRN